MSTDANSILVDMSRQFLAAGHFNGRIKSILYKFEDNGKLVKTDELKLMKYVHDCHKICLSSGRSELSIRDMKTNILRMIGSEPSCSYASTVSREDLKKIYNFFVALPESVFEDVEGDEND